MHVYGTKALTFFWGTILTWRGKQAVIWGTALKCPLCAGLARIILMRSNIFSQTALFEKLRQTTVILAKCFIQSNL